MRTLLLLPLLASCIPDEQGIDHTILHGTISIPPAAVNDGRTNDGVSNAQALGPDDSTALTYRSVVVSGTVNSWEPGLGHEYGDPDYYAFAPLADGTFTFTLAFTTTTTASGDSGAMADADVFDVKLIDPAAVVECDASDTGDTGCVPSDGVLTEASTDGTAGAFTMSWDVTANTTYVLLVAGTSTDDTSEKLPYTLTVSGSAPTDTSVMVGAYLEQDPTVSANPVGGSNATDWTYDAATATWTGAWRMMWIRQVETEELDTDAPEGSVPASTVTESPSTVYVRAGTLTSLNASLAAGTLYSSSTVEVSVSGHEQTVEQPVVLDAVAPKVIGQQITETLPDTTVAEIDLSDYSLVTDTLVAQDIGMFTGLGYVDVVTGTSAFDPAASGWNGTNDSDAYAFTVPETMYVRMTASWPDTASDLDFGIWYPDPDYGTIDLFSTWSDDYCLTGDNPEVCESAITLEPDTTYYLVALGYLGTDEEPYTVELEWVAP